MLSHIMLVLSGSKIVLPILLILTIAIYLLVSIRLLVVSRALGSNVGMFAMIPVLNLLLIFYIVHSKIKKSKIYQEDEEIEL